MTDTKRFMITTPIYYANAPVHLGHAYATTACDVLARWRRLRGDDVFFLTGLDEHGGNIEKVAQEAGTTPQAWCDRIAQEDQAIFADLNLTNDDFIRTTEERHRLATEAFWKQVRGSKTPKGHEPIYKGSYEGWYCPRCEAYYVEEELQGGNCPVHQLPAERLKEDSYFFRLSDYGEWLTENLVPPDAPNPEGKTVVTPVERYNEVMGFVKEGLRDVSISRTKIGWGFPVPDAPGHVIYVWFDALINYLTALGYPKTDGQRWPYWPADMHVVGKEIIRFHALLWPAMLHAANLPRPKRLVVHGWWLVEGAKMSKTTGNVADPRDFAKEFSLDAVRHFLLAEKALAADGDFSRRRFIERYNADLANVLGNLAHRTISMAHRYLGGTVTLPTGPCPWETMIRAARKDRPESLAQFDRIAKAEQLSFIQAVFVGLGDRALAVPEFHEALFDVWEVIKMGNGYLDNETPWGKDKTEAQRAENFGQVIRLLEAASFLLLAFMPAKAEELRRRLGVNPTARAALPASFTLTAGDPLFPRVETKPRAAA